MGRVLAFLRETAALAGYLTVIAAFLGSIWLLIKRPWRSVTRRLKLIDEIGLQFGPNGGKSIKDEIDRQGRELDRQGEVQQVQGIALSRMQATITGMVDVLERPVFETNQHGHFVRVSRAFELQFGYSASDMQGLGWLQVVHPEHRERIAKEWEWAIKDQRAFSSQVRMISRGGMGLLANLHAHPSITQPEHNVIGWMGSVELIAVTQPRPPAEHNSRPE